jgi:hypothetical protein
LRLEPGDALEMENAGEQITLRRVWVFHSGQHLPAAATDEMLRRIREERDLQNIVESE